MSPAQHTPSWLLSLTICYGEHGRGQAGEVLVAEGIAGLESLGGNQTEDLGSQVTSTCRGVDTVCGGVGMWGYGGVGVWGGVCMCGCERQY